MNKKNIIIGTRGSALSVKQTLMVQSQLLALYPALHITIKIIKTMGDTNLLPIPLDTVGKGWFTKELDSALLDGTVDIAVHSLKDIEILPAQLIIAGIPEREDARDVFISQNNILFKNLKSQAVIGTDSTRRKSQILHKRPDLVVKSVRGNVDTRIDKVAKGEYDGIFLAAAGLKRLGLADTITQYFDYTDIVPAPGQGALAVVIKKDAVALSSLITQLNHPQTVCAVEAERLFSVAMQGGCRTPIGAYAICDGENILLYGMIGSLDGKYLVKKSVGGLCNNKTILVKQLTQMLLNQSNAW